MIYTPEPEIEYFDPYLIRCGSCKHFQVVDGDADQSYGFCKLTKLSRASLDKACETHEDDESFF